MNTPNQDDRPDEELLECGYVVYHRLLERPQGRWPLPEIPKDELLLRVFEPKD